MIKRRLIYFCSMIMLLFCGILLSSCCSPADCVVKVTFIGVDEDLDLKSYNYNVTFNDPTTITIDIPEGYDHRELVGSIDGVVQSYTIDFESDVEEDYWYSIGKSLTYKIANVKRSFELKIDVTKMPKLQYNINLENGMNDFKVVTIAPENLERLTVLNRNNITSEVNFTNGTASVKYGEYVLLIHSKNISSGGKTYETLYSDVNHFTETEHISNIGTINYSFYNVSKKGNTRYNFDGDVYTSIYYIGKIQEDINFYSSVPNYIEDKGFEFDRAPNVFYLFTNLSEYNSDLCTIEAYTSSSVNYDSNDNSVDRIDNNVIRRVSPDSIYNERYDVHKVYLGDDLYEDVLLDMDDKLSINNDLYIKISSTIDLENLNIKLLNYERESINNAYELNADLVSDKGYTYIKLSKEDMLQFSLQRDLIGTNNIVYNYYSGSAILYIEVDYTFFQNDRISGSFKYSRIWLTEEILDSDVDVTDADFHFAVYIKDSEGNKDYGLIDYHYEGYSKSPRDCTYFETIDLFDENNVYRNNLYVEIRGKEYVDYRSITIQQLGFEAVGVSLTPFEQIKVTNAKEYNGYKDFPITFKEKETLSEYWITVDINLNDALMQTKPVNFSELNLPAYQGEGVYVTNNVLFDELSDFSFVSYINKDGFSTATLSSYYDLYYFVRCVTVDNFDFDIYLNPEDRTTKVSSSKILCDIVGNPLTLTINGEPYYVKVLMQDTIYETIDGNIYAIEKES